MNDQSPLDWSHTSSITNNFETKYLSRELRDTISGEASAEITKIPTSNFLAPEDGSINPEHHKIGSEWKTYLWAQVHVTRYFY